MSYDEFGFYSPRYMPALVAQQPRNSWRGSRRSGHCDTLGRNGLEIFPPIPTPSPFSLDTAVHFGKPPRCRCLYEDNTEERKNEYITHSGV